LIESKIRRILDIAAENNHKDLILGAWGCGIFNNDPKHIAGVFMGLLAGEYSGVFEQVIFAVPGAHSVNHKAFQEALFKG
jgi:uncharacterized protein (TIGR02452 family)